MLQVNYQFIKIFLFLLGYTECMALYGNKLKNYILKSKLTLNCALVYLVW